MGSDRVHVVLSAEERAQFRAQAEREGTSLSAWLREAAHARLAAQAPTRLDSVDALAEFFAACDEREAGREPDWDEHVRTIAGSRRAGGPPA